MEIEAQIKIQTTEIEALEFALNLAHQGYKDQASFIIAMFGLFGSWHKDKLFYYFKVAKLKGGRK